MRVRCDFKCVSFVFPGVSFISCIRTIMGGSGVGRGGVRSSLSMEGAGGG